MYTTYFLVFIVAILLLGAKNIISTKGTVSHGVIGKIAIITLIITIFSGFWLLKDNDNISIIYILSFWIYLCVAVSFIAIKKGFIILHAVAMVSIMIAILCIGILAYYQGYDILNYLLINTFPKMT